MYQSTYERVQKEKADQLVFAERREARREQSGYATFAGFVLGMLPVTCVSEEGKILMELCRLCVDRWIGV